MLNAADWRRKIQDYYAGRLTEQEQIALLRWMEEQTPEQLAELFPVEEGLEMGAYSLTAAQLENVLRRVKGRSMGRNKVPMAGSAGVGQAGRKAAPVVRLAETRRRIYWRAACVAALLGIGGWLVSRYIQSSDKAAGGNTIALQHYHTIRVADGSRSRIKLPDGTAVVLNGGSVLDIPDQFSANTREVYLKDGEALFDVAKDAGRPFIVHSHDLNIRVLGTAFSIRDYADERSAEAGVRSGRVAVSRQSASMGEEAMFLSAGDKAVLNKSQAMLAKQSCDTADVAAWVRGELIFRGATLHHVLNVLKHRYAVSFDVQRTDIEEEKFSATFRNYSLETILQQLQLMSGLQYKFEGKTILIH